MVGFLITGHGNFASGFVSAIELVAGSSERIIGVDFLQSYSTDDLKSKLLEAVGVLTKSNDEILILSDLIGGSPYNQAVMVKIENPHLPIEVISGVNFPMVLTGLFEGENLTVKELTQSMIEKGKESISSFVPASPVKKIMNEDDGI